MLKITHIFLIIEHYRTANNSMTFLSPQWSLLVIEITFMWLPGHRSFFLVNNQVFVHKLYFSPDHLGCWCPAPSVPIPAARGDPIAVFRFIKAGDQSAPVLAPSIMQNTSDHVCPLHHQHIVDIPTSHCRDLPRTQCPHCVDV